MFGNKQKKAFVALRNGNIELWYKCNHLMWNCVYILCCLITRKCNTDKNSHSLTIIIKHITRPIPREAMLRDICAKNCQHEYIFSKRAKNAICHKLEKFIMDKWKRPQWSSFQKNIYFGLFDRQTDRMKN